MTVMIIYDLVLLLPDATQSAIKAQYVVCYLPVRLSVCLSVRGVQVP